MLRSLFCAAAVFTLVLSLCLIPQTASARRCPEKEPETLLSLYQNSDAIYVAAFDKITQGEVVETNDDYSVQEIKKHFTISSTLKGESRKFFVLDDREYSYRTAAQVIEKTEAVSETAEEPETPKQAEEPEYEVEEDSPELKSGDTLLLFVKNGGDEEEGPTLTDYRDGAKQLSMEKIAVYEARINELNAIFNAKKVNEAKLLEWLIRCAEDPVTRWEGTYELLGSVQNHEWREQEVERRKERIAKGEPVEESAAENGEKEEEVEEIETKNFDTSVFAKMLDINHKQTLANILLNGHGSKSNAGPNEPVMGDRELIELVKRWGDPRLIGFLLDSLRAGSDDASSNADTMAIVAEILGDDEAAEIAQRYQENAYDDENEIVEADDQEAIEVEVPAADKTEQGETVEAEPASESADPVANEEAEPHAKPEIKKQTYKELRAELMQKFLAQCDKAIAQKEKEAEVKSAR